MFEFSGKYNSCKVFANEIEKSAEDQIKTFLNHEAFTETKIRIMPDVHAGAGSVIGFTSTCNDMIIPNCLGVDIGCGVLAFNLGIIDIDFKKFNHQLQRSIPSGFKKRTRKSSDLAEIFTRKELGNKDFKCFIEELSNIANVTNQKQDDVEQSLGTLGGGNHFIELDKDNNDNVWLVVHSGSRNYGFSIANFHQKIAIKKQGKQKGLEYLQNDDRLNYLKHMQHAQIYAQLNRQLIAFDLIQKDLKLDFFNLEQVESVHNYLNFNDNIMRKGAISAHKGEKVIIPWNMRDGMIIGEGKGNEEWNFSAPHGAGRVLSRTKAKEQLSLDVFQQHMKDVWSSCVSLNTLDESPMAYKDPSLIKACLSETVDIKLQLKPIYNFKSSE